MNTKKISTKTCHIIDHVTSKPCECVKHKIIELNNNDINIIGENNIYCQGHDKPDDENNITEITKENGDKIYECLDYKGVIKNAKKLPNFRTCKQCEDHLPIDKFKKCYSKISVNSRKHICEDCEKDLRKIKNQEYYNKKKNAFK